MTVYCLYSLLLESPRPLCHVAPVAHAIDEPPDIVLSCAQSYASLPEWTNTSWSPIREVTGPGWRLALSTALPGGDAVLRLDTRRYGDDTTVIFGRNAAQIAIAWSSTHGDAEGFWRELSSWILGSVLGFAMCLRGLPTLHGSVVAVDGRAVGLLGVSGAGKSTLAAAFVSAGHSMLADDHLVVGGGAQGFNALPGPPRLRLWASSLPVIENAQDAPTIWSDDDGKLHVAPAVAAYCGQPQPLAALYVLMPREPDRTHVAIERLTPAAALNALMNQRFCMSPFSPTYAAESMAALSALVQRTPVNMLYRPHGLETLPGVVDAICEDTKGHDR